MTRRDGTVLGFTDHDRHLLIDDVWFEPQSGFTQSEARQSLGMAVDMAEVEGAIASDTLDDNDIDAGLFDGAAVETWLVNWQDVAERTLLRTASVAGIVRRDRRFIAELESRTASLDRPNGRYLRRRCDAVLGDARCGVAVEGARLTGQGWVDGVTPAGLRVGGLSAFDEGWFDHGELFWTSGPQVGRTIRVARHTVDLSGVMVALEGEPSDEAGAEFTIKAGCDGQFSTCRTKFSNAVNFRGFPHLPGNDAAYAYVTEGVVFDGGPLVE